MTSATAASTRDALVARAHAFAEATIRPAAPAWDRESAPIAPVVRDALAAEVFGPDWRIPGEDDAPADALRVYEELGWGCAGFAYAVHASGLAARTLRTVGTPEQAERLLPLLSCSEAEIRLGALALSEPGAGSDVAAIATTAVPDGDTYVLNGQKTFITNALDASAIVVYATADRNLGWAGLAPYLVPRDASGLQVAPTARPLGVRAGRFGDLTLTDCRIPADHRLGRSDVRPPLAGLRILDTSRPVVAAIAVGLARAAQEYAVAHAKRREQFGRPLATQQAVAFSLADMAIHVEAARQLTWYAGTVAGTEPRRRRGESSMAKCFATEMAMAVTTRAVQLLGGAGCTDAHPVEKWMRDAKLLEICEGPSEIQRLIVSRALLQA